MTYRKCDFFATGPAGIRSYRLRSDKKGIAKSQLMIVRWSAKGSPYMVNPLFNIPVQASSAALRPGSARQEAAARPSTPAVVTPPAPVPEAVGVITAQQSAITFAGAPAAVTLVCKVLGVAAPTWGSSKLLAIVLSLFVGMLIYWQSVPGSGTSREKITGFVFALINSFAIAAAALGISAAASPDQHSAS